ncbi:Crp/Fnr family transcriptional regulator [Paenibacillus glycinis]|uniref:Cyclic nucleotide-binding domain-containing protein n=1 Tax=Paenibacillus glycinis TaxID=2697035 RepID=A0ABW9XXF6_9BACL|nr:cyclic nucleotide-binding domain-containing protein [Paenibacillus glycinis]NBD26954.1 cyclic nucleotide-binding domain-containing protein [Paenibacillus glycinis]
MIESKDRGQLEGYLREYRLADVFNEALLPHLTLCVFQRGELICSQGEPSETLYFLVRGKLKIYTNSAEGRTLILSFRKPPDTIGDIEYVRDADILNTVEAVSTVHMIGVQYRWLRKHAGDHAPLLRFLLDVIAGKFYAKSISLSFNLMHPVEVRLASYLLSVSFDESDAQLQGQLSTAGLRDAANLIGTSYRHLNRVIGQFCAEGLLERGKGVIRVKDRAGLSVRAKHNIYE